MIRYNPIKLDNALKLEILKGWVKKGLVTEEGGARLSEGLYDTYRKHHFMARIGLFVFSLIVANASLGLFGFMTLSSVSEEAGISVFLIASGLLTLWVMDFLIRKNNYHRNGIDDALLYFGLAYITGGIFATMFDDAPERSAVVLLLSFTGCIIMAVATRLYADAITAVAAVYCLTVFTVNLAALGMPDVFLPSLLSIPLNLILLRYTDKLLEDFKYRHYYFCLRAAKIAMYLLIYFAASQSTFSGLYFIPYTDELVQNAAIHFTWMRWVYLVASVLVPLGYIYLGLRRKYRELLLSGLILISFSVVSIRYYFHVMPVEFALMLGGLVMGILSYIFIQRLRKNTASVYTFEADPDEEMSQAEWLLITRQYMNKTVTEDKGLMDGGDFGGGGASEKF